MLKNMSVFRRWRYLHDTAQNLQIVSEIFKFIPHERQKKEIFKIHIDNSESLWYTITWLAKANRDVAFDNFIMSVIFLK